MLVNQEVLNDLAFLEHVLGDMEDSDIRLREDFDVAHSLFDLVVYTIVGELKAMRFYSDKPPYCFAGALSRSAEARAYTMERTRSMWNAYCWAEQQAQSDHWVKTFLRDLVMLKGARECNFEYFPGCQLENLAKGIRSTAFTKPVEDDFRVDREESSRHRAGGLSIATAWHQAIAREQMQDFDRARLHIKNADRQEAKKHPYTPSCHNPRQNAFSLGYDCLDSFSASDWPKLSAAAWENIPAATEALLACDCDLAKLKRFYCSALATVGTVIFERASGLKDPLLVLDVTEYGVVVAPMVAKSSGGAHPIRFSCVTLAWLARVRSNGGKCVSTRQTVGSFKK